MNINNVYLYGYVCAGGNFVPVGSVYIPPYQYAAQYAVAPSFGAPNQQQQQQKQQQQPPQNMPQQCTHGQVNLCSAPTGASKKQKQQRQQPSQYTPQQCTHGQFNQCSPQPGASGSGSGAAAGSGANASTSTSLL